MSKTKTDTSEAEKAKAAEAEKATEAEKAKAAEAEKATEAEKAKAAEAEKATEAEKAKVTEADNAEAEARRTEEIAKVRRCAELIHEKIRGDVPTLMSELKEKYGLELDWDGEAGKFVVTIFGEEAYGKDKRTALTNWGNKARRALLQVA